MIRGGPGCVKPDWAQGHAGGGGAGKMDARRGAKDATARRAEPTGASPADHEPQEAREVRGA